MLSCTHSSVAFFLFDLSSLSIHKLVLGYVFIPEKCWRVHFGLPYKWEVELDEVWIDLPDNEVIERDYCDPAKIHRCVNSAALNWL